MVKQEDVRLIALALPGVTATRDLGFGVDVGGGKVKGIAWSWKERVDPKKARVPNLGVLAVRVANLDAKDALLAGMPEKLFTEPHYNGYAAVLVRLAKITKTELKKLLADAHACTTARKVKKPRRRS